MSYCTDAVQRKYESMRWQWLLEEKENSMELVEEQTKINKYRARRVRVSHNIIHIICTCTQIHIISIIMFVEGICFLVKTNFKD